MKRCRSIKRALKRGHLLVLDPYSSMFGCYRAKKDVTFEKKRFQALMAKELKKKEQEDGGTN